MSESFAGKVVDHLAYGAEGRPVGVRQRFRFRDYKVTAVPDALSLPTLSAVCVTGETADCGARSGDETDPDALVRWIAEHCAATGHETYEHHTMVTVRAEPGAWQ